MSPEDLNNLAVLLKDHNRLVEAEPADEASLGNRHEVHP